MLKLHRELQAGRFPNCRKLADSMEVSSKTIQRDIEFMRSRLNLPIEYDQLQFGFYYTEPVTNFPSIEVTEGEIVALFVAQKALEQYKGTSFEKPLHAAFRKITDGLRESVTFPWDDLDATISFRGIGTTVGDVDLFESLSKAVLRSQEIVFEYNKLGGTRHEGRRVQPYHLGCVENQWYLFGFDLARKQVRTFALPRMRSIQITPLKFKRPANFTISNYLGGAFGVFAGDGKFRIRIRFDAFAGRLVGERRWHASQKIRPLGKQGDDGVELTLELGSLEEVMPWVLSWGGHARVLEPKELAERVKSAARAILEE
jgi:proteasome accessory factor B